MKESTTETIHVPVLLFESIEGLNIDSNGIYLDGTLGGAGHAEEIAKRLSAKGVLIGCDVDSEALARATERLESYPCQKHFAHDNFRNLESILEKSEIEKVSGILLDLGWSSFQIADPERGLSFLHDGPLDMNLSKGMVGERLTAYEIINFWEEEAIADILFKYGDERKSRIIAKHIVEARKKQHITTTGELAQLVIKILHPKAKENPYFKIHPATKVFQALRIAVNDELQVITDAIHAGIKKLNHGGRFAIITFHSGEDRIVKHLFREYADQGKVTLITKKPTVPSESEIHDNPRSRSSKLRIIQKI